MRKLALGILAGACLATAALTALSDPGAAYGQLPTTPDGGTTSDLIGLTMSVGQTQQQVVLVDARQRALCVYHVDTASGKIELKSVRNFHWDAQLLDYNGTSPLPQEIRSLLEQKHRSQTEQQLGVQSP